MDKKSIFIIHGRDDALRMEVEAFVREIGYEPIVLAKQRNGGRTIIKKFEDYAAKAFYAIALFTPDDRGGLNNGKGARVQYRNRARQNVVFEYGYFFAKIGRDHVCALHKGDMDMPTDSDGIVYIPYDTEGKWKLQMKGEIQGVARIQEPDGQVGQPVTLMISRRKIHGRRGIIHSLQIDILNNGNEKILVKEAGIETPEGCKFAISKLGGTNKVPRTIDSRGTSKFVFSIDKISNNLNVNSFAYIMLADGKKICSENFTEEIIAWHGVEPVRRYVYVKG